MNWQHLRAFVWLRWRLLTNQWRRAGKVNAAILMIATVGALVTAIPLFIGCFMLGLYAIPKAEPAQLMYAWDGVIALFLLFWSIGLVTELQRTEPLSLSKLLHLPVSVKGAFLINYLSSLVRLSLVVFGPIMLGYSLALVVEKGLSELLVLPLLAAFLLMITALTYQIQGWLASLMTNPRRRRTVIMSITAFFILCSQLPNLINFARPWGNQGRADRSKQLVEDLALVNRDLQSRKIDAGEASRRQQEVNEKYISARQQADRESIAYWEQLAQLVNMVLPLGWLPLGVKSAAEGNMIPSLLGLLGMTAIGTASLWRAYSTTIRLYQGHAKVEKSRPAVLVTSPDGVRKRGGLLLEARLPVFSEPVSGIALGSFRSLLRAPEAKMMLLTPLILGPIFGSMLFKNQSFLPEAFRPLVATGAMVFILLGMLQLLGNQFGFDRDGFRVFVLCAASRRDILLGKNLAFAPLALGIPLILLPVVQFMCPMKLEHLFSMVPQYITAYLLFCVFTNLMSIYAPVHLPAGSLKASSPKITTVLVQLAMVFFLFPLSQAAALLPLGIETMLRILDWNVGSIPIYLLTSLTECTLVVVFYRFSLDWQGDLLQSREQRILEIVTSKTP